MADGSPPGTSSPPPSAPSVTDLGAAANTAAQTAKSEAATIPGTNTTGDQDKNTGAKANTDSTAAPEKNWWHRFYDDSWADRHNVGTRLMGGVKAVGGGATAVGGVVGGVLSSPTVVGAAAGGAVAVGGADVAWSGLKQIWYGEEQSSYLAQGTGAIAEKLGGDGKAVAITKGATEFIEGGGVQGTIQLIKAAPKAFSAVSNFFTGAKTEATIANGVDDAVAASGATNTAATTTPTAATTVSEPVSVSTGEYLETWRDFLIPGADLALDGSRYMGLKLPMPTRWRNPLGFCQISAFDEFFANPSRGMLEFHRADGKVITFERPFNFLPSINGSYPHLELKAPVLGELSLKDRRIVKHFVQYDDRFYRLEKIEDLNGNALAFIRSETGVLEKIESSDGLSLVFSNDGEGRRLSITLVGIDGSTLELVHYAYDGRGRMVSADCTFGMSVRYYWSATKPLLKRWHNLTRRSETVFQYDAEGRVIHTTTNGIWNDDRFRYDHEKCETIYLPAGKEGRAQRFEYDEHKNVTAEIDALGGIIRHRYNSLGLRTATTDANAHTATTQYDQYGNVREFTDAEGRSTVYGWGPHGDVDTIIDGAGGVRKFENDRFGNVVAARDAEKHETRFERDERGRLIKTIFANGSEETRAYDECGRLAQIRDAKGGLTQFRYDAFGRLVERVDALDGVTRFDYQASAGGFATPTQLTRPDGVSIGRSFDAEGSLASVSDGEGRQWHYRFGAFEVLEAIVDPKGGELSFGYDSEGRLTAVTNAMGRVYSFNRDIAGRVIEEEDFDGRVTHYVRDAGGRVIETTKPDGGRLNYSYDKTDKVTRIETFAPHCPHIKHMDDEAREIPQDVTRFWYDGRGLLIKAENGASLIEYERNRNGAIIAETVNGRRVEVKLDAMGRRVERKLITPAAADPGEDLVAYSHDPLGLIKSLTIDGHAPLSFCYDPLGRETRRSSPVGFQLASRYDVAGQLIEQTGVRDPAQYIRWAAFGDSALHSLCPVLEGAPGIERRYRWDRAKSPLAILDTLWGETTYEYDATGQVETAQAGEGTSNELRERFAYDAARNLAGTAAAGAGKLHGFGEALGKLTAWSNTPGGAVQIARGPRGERLALSHDACGRVIERKVERNGFRPKVWRYEWDVHDRLVKCTTPEGDTWRYGYDPFGRRMWKVRELTQAEARGHAGRFPNLITANRVIPDYASSLLPPPSERRRILPGQGVEDKGRPPVVGVAYGWDGDVIAEEAALSLNGAIDWRWATRWYYEPDSFRPLAKQEAPQRKQREDGSWEEQRRRLLYIVTDHLGTPREMVDQHGKVQWAASYTTWGSIRGLKIAALKAEEVLPANDDSAKNFRPIVVNHTDYTTHGNLALKSVVHDASVAQLCPIRFQGQWQDEETGLHYNWHRHYDPLAGQYTSPDPIGLAGGSRSQGYVENPNAWIDPRGLVSTVGGVNIAGKSTRELAGSYEQAIRNKFGSGAQAPAKVPGVGQPDDIILNASGQRIAVEAKYTGDWSKSPYNPNSFFNQRGLGNTNPSVDMLEQLRRYNQMPGGVNFYTNSSDLANFVNQQGIANVRVYVSPATAN